MKLVQCLCKRKILVYFKAAYKMLSILQHELFIEKYECNLKVTILLKDLRNYKGSPQYITLCNIWATL